METYEDYLNRKKNGGRIGIKLFKNMQPFHIILIIVIVGVGIVLYNKNKSNLNTILLIGFGSLIVYLFLLTKMSGDKPQIPRDVAQRIALEDLKSNIGINGGYVEGTQIVPTGYFRDHTWDDGEGAKLFKYHIGFLIKEKNKPPVEVDYQMNPFTGYSKGIVGMDLGFNGQEIKDIKFVLPKTVVEEKK